MSPNPYWFPAKRSWGWGWAWPSSWQGLAVTLAYVALFAAGFLVFSDAVALLGYAFVLTAVLIAICWWKGEPLK